MTTKTEHPVAGDVSEQYAHPDDILNDRSLTNAQKIKTLKEWEQDLRQLMVASEENMPGTTAGQPAESLQHVREALATLSATGPGDKGSPSKTG
ncbi:hypothetical protein [Iodidimonas sp. SYSU 1G8]|uniref:hypothetical protein n=1 Tax=Iodidimonas sp. SYSU 1G8 TaxID=3133967 RepID=UPI0031FE6876